jgi:hypothetical protein
MMQSKYKSIFNAGKLSAVLIIIGVGFVSAFLMTSQLQSPIIQTVMNQKRGVWEALGDANMTGTNSGFVTGQIRIHEAAPATTYATNVTNATAYEYSDTYSTAVGSPKEMTGETPYSTPFNFYVKIRLNASDGYNTSSSLWMKTWLHVNLTVDFQWAADIAVTAMTIVEIANNTNFAWYACYLDNAGAGYQIAKNEKIQLITIDARVYR